MNKTLVIALASIVVAILSVQMASFTSDGSSNLTLDPPKTVPYVDLYKYIGLWY